MTRRTPHTASQIGKLDLLEAFCSHNGPDFYGLPRNEGTVTLERTPHKVVAKYHYGTEGGFLVPLRANAEVEWTLDVPPPKHLLCAPVIST